MTYIIHGGTFGAKSRLDGSGDYLTFSCDPKQVVVEVDNSLCSAGLNSITLPMVNAAGNPLTDAEQFNILKKLEELSGATFS